MGRTVRCSVNAGMGREKDVTIDKAERPKKVAVVGGGPAGMEAARVCALRGHEVTLFEKRSLGGALREASVPDFKADIRPLISYFSVQMESLGVNVVKKEVTADDIHSGGFDAVIAATGAAPVQLDIPGIDHAMVCGALEALKGEVRLGDDVLIVGGGMVGIETALMVADKCKSVTLIEMTDDALANLAPDEKTIYVERLKRDCAATKTGTRLIGVSDGVATVADRFGREEKYGATPLYLPPAFGPRGASLRNLQGKPASKSSKSATASGRGRFSMQSMMDSRWRGGMKHKGRKGQDTPD